MRNNWKANLFNAFEAALVEAIAKSSEEEAYEEALEIASDWEVALEDIREEQDEEKE